ncbi:MAG: hypothetical protein ACRD4Q_07460 [Candidatus Acidiferrales bacterium]
MLTHLRKWWAVYGTFIIAAAIDLLPGIQHWIAKDPKLSGLGVILSIIGATFLKSPVKQ